MHAKYAKCALFYFDPFACFWSFRTSQPSADLTQNLLHIPKINHIAILLQALCTDLSGHGVVVTMQWLPKTIKGYEVRSRKFQALQPGRIFWKKLHGGWGEMHPEMLSLNLKLRCPRPCPQIIDIPLWFTKKNSIFINLSQGAVMLQRSAGKVKRNGNYLYMKICLQENGEK